MGVRYEYAGLSVHEALADAVVELAEAGGVPADAVWTGLAEIVRRLGPRNQELLARRNEFQQAIDDWGRERLGERWDVDAYCQFLREIGYLVEEGPKFEIETEHLDDEISAVSGPQLVVPLDNARYALNAANARWGSLYDALYGTDAIDEHGGDDEVRVPYNPQRGERAIRRANVFLDDAVPLERGSHHDVVRYNLADRRLTFSLTNGDIVALRHPSQFVGQRTHQRGDAPEIVLLRNHGLHIEVHIDPADPVGQQHPAGVKDILLESALTTIQDCEDSVAACDAEEKALVYRNWGALMRGSLSADFEKAGAQVQRTLNPDRQYIGTDGRTLSLPGRSLLLIRHVGHHMYTDAVTTDDGQSIPETFLDAMVTTLGALPNIGGKTLWTNSRHGSIYVVKPKLHGPEEVQLAVELFASIEKALSIPPKTLKIGIMDEERRTTLNLKGCVRVAKDRIFFINTGFLDRTGDDIHTNMELGPMVPKAEIKDSRWMTAYEDWNVSVGLECGFPGRGQIGKGMWAMPDDMRKLLDQKIAHPQAGANCAWVPSPTSATLHAMHYHAVDVHGRQRELLDRPRPDIKHLLEPSLIANGRKIPDGDVVAELENNIQGILGYVVRWVQQGVGCSKISDIHDVQLMEDRATLRISSQHIANWLHHKIVDEDLVHTTLRRMAKVVDQQNSTDTTYRPMTDNLEDSFAFQAATELIFKGIERPNGYTETALYRARLECKTKRYS